MDAHMGTQCQFEMTDGDRNISLLQSLTSAIYNWEGHRVATPVYAAKSDLAQYIHTLD